MAEARRAKISQGKPSPWRGLCLGLAFTSSFLSSVKMSRHQYTKHSTCTCMAIYLNLYSITAAQCGAIGVDPVSQLWKHTVEQCVIDTTCASSSLASRRLIGLLIGTLMVHKTPFISLLPMLISMVSLNYPMSQLISEMLFRYVLRYIHLVSIHLK